MTSTEDVDKVVQDACEAAARGDASKVMTCLNSREVTAPTGLDEPLLPMSASACHLLENLNDGPFHPEHALRALMSIPCCYETPWRASLAMIQAFHSQRGNLGKQSGKVLWTCVTDVQTFLQLTVEAWWKQERQRTSSTSQSRVTQNFATTDKTPRHLLEQLADAILRPLDNEEITASRDNQHWTQPLELVTTIVSLCQDLEPCGKGTLADHVLDRLFPSSIRPDRLLPWLTLASDLRSHLRSCDWTRLHAILQECITQNTDSIPPADMPGLVRGIVSFLVKQDEEEQAWELLILHLLYSASLDATTYSTVETVLKSSLASLPNPVLGRCLHAVNSGCASVPNWICSNMNLLLLQAVQQSGSQLVSSLVSRALGGRGGDGESDLPRQCWESLKQLAFPSLDESTRGRRRKQSSQIEVEAVKAAVDGVYYQENGQFMKDGEDCVGRNISTKLVCLSIFLGKTRPSKRSHHVFASERAQLWIHAADTILRPSLDATGSGPQTSLDVLFAILIVVTVFCEVPASRSTIVRTAMQFLSGKDSYMASNDVSSFHCAVVAMLVRSLMRTSHYGDGIQELHPLSGIFGESLVKDVFCDLTTALSPLPPARSALLTISRKYLQSSFGGNLWWDMGTASRGMQENRNRVDCALHGVCTLLATTENQQSWDDCGIESWVILSDVIVQNKPALPLSERSGLFLRLASFTKLQRFSLNTIDHLIRACLVRLLYFFEGDDEESLELIPERVFVTWGSRDTSTEAGANVSQREDIAGLLRLVVLLLEQQAVSSDEGPSNNDVLCQGRDRILRLLSCGDDRVCEHFVTNDSQCPTEDSDGLPEAGGCLCSSIACACIAAVLQSATSSRAPAQLSKQIRRHNEGKRVVEMWRENLISFEIEECSGHDMKDDPAEILSWLKCSSQSTADAVIRHNAAPDTGSKHRLLSSVCDIVLDLIFHPVWSNNTSEPKEEERQHMMKSAISLLSVKRDLLKHCDGGIYVKESDLPELSFNSTTLTATAVPFLQLCSHFFNKSLSHSINLDVAEGVLLSLLTFCAALKQLALDEEKSENAIDARTRLQIARQVWNLYRAVADEKSARRLVRYLEEQGASQLESSLDHTPKSLSFLTIKTDEDVDAIVQRVRLSIVTAMGAWLQSLSGASTEPSGTLGVVTSQVHSYQADVSLSTAFWLQILRSFCSDLKTGLDGRSGGMTEELYSAYLSLIETVCNLVSLMILRKADLSSVSKASKVTSECATLLKEVLCHFPLKGAAQFKKTMMLSISELPSIQRQASFTVISSGRGLLPPCTNNFAVTVFYQMMRVAERQHGLSNSESTTWSEIAGPEHVDVAIDDASSGDDSMNLADTPLRSSAAVGSSKVPTTIVIPGRVTRQTRKNAASADEHEKKVQLPSKESCLWASCCSLVAMEQIWVECYSILNSNTADDSQQKSPSASAWEVYYLERTQFISDVLKAACFAMKSCEELKGADGKEKPSEKEAATILASTFTDAVKVRFCMLLEKISAVLQLALRCILNQIKRGDEIGDLVRAESMACLSAWLTVELEDLGLECLSKRWFQAEKQSSHGEECAGVHKQLSPTLRRLPKFLIRIQELETDLGKLFHALGKIEQDGTQVQCTALDQYEALLNTETDNETPQVTLQSLIKTKLMSLAKARTSSDMFGLSLVGDAKDSGATRKRSRKAPNLDRQMRKERNRNVKRSRNQIVDDWLHLDDEYERDEGADDDAYVDLEDFIV